MKEFKLLKEKFNKLREKGIFDLYENCPEDYNEFRTSWEELRNRADEMYWLLREIEDEIEILSAKSVSNIILENDIFDRFMKACSNLSGTNDVLLKKLKKKE